MLGQVLSFPSRQWLSALPPGVPAHPPAPGPARSPTFDISWGLNSLVLCRAVNTRKRERPTKMGLQNEPDVHQSGTLGACRPGHLTLFCLKVVGSGRGTEKLERPSPNLT